MRRALLACCLLAVAGAACGGPEARRGAGAGAAIPAAAPGSEAATAQSRVLVYTADPTVERTLGTGSVHRFPLDLDAGEYLRVEADQRGVDLVLRLVDPAGRPVAAADRPTGARGPETLELLAPAAGRHRLEVAAWRPSAPPGEYRLRLLAHRAPTAADRHRAAAADALERGEERAAAGDAAGAEAAYRRALAVWERLDDPLRRAETHRLLGRLVDARGDWERSLREHGRALDQARRCGGETAPVWTAIAATHLGTAHLRLGDLGAAADAYREAVASAAVAAERRVEAAALYNLGQVHHLRGEPRPALERYERALALARQVADPGLEARTHHDLGLLHLSLGRSERALDHLRLAERHWRRAGDARALGACLAQLGRLLLDRGDAEAGLAHLEEALALRRAAGDRRGEAVALTALGRAHHDRGDLVRAAPLLERAAATFEALGDRRAAARALQNLGSLERARGRPAAAAALYRRALPLHREHGDVEARVETLLGLARVERAGGELAAAAERLDEAIAVAEDFRTSLAPGGLRAAYFSVVQTVFRLAVTVALERAEQTGDRAQAARAFALAERGRARALLDHLAAGPGAVAAGPDGARLALLAERRERLLETAAAPGDPRLEAIERELRGLLERRETSSAGVAAPADLAAVQRHLPAGTALLAYSLGNDRSAAWTVSRSSWSVHRLAAGAEIDRAARDAHRLLAASGRREARAATGAALARLAELALAPVAAAPELARAERLLVVPAGALSYVPFAALPDPADRQEEPLAARREIAHLPSASVAVALASRYGSGLAAGAGGLAVVADPVFGPDDARLPPEVRRAAGGRPPLPYLGRLAHTRREAAAVLELAGDAGTLAATGFAARKDLVTGGGLAGYRLLHFATHGTLDDTLPELSGLVFSRLDPHGRPLDGHLRVHEIHRLRLTAELVVLSACRTALGDEVRGEGLVGLTHAFLEAGAKAVLVSLWEVDDRATAELMGRFYRHLLADGRSPAAALRRAQLEIREDPRWSSPYYWAGFTLQGIGAGRVRTAGGR